MPVKALLENLENGARVDDFLEWFPGVTREQVEAVLRHAERSLAAAGSLDEPSPAPMKILFDQGTPAPLRHLLAGHTVCTAYLPKVTAAVNALRSGDFVELKFS